MKRVDDRKIGEILEQDFQIPRHYVHEVLLKKSSNIGNKKFGEIAISLGLINEETVYRALAKQYDMKFVSSIEAKNSFIFDLYKRPEINRIFGGEDDLIKEIKNNKAFPAFIKFEQDSPHITLRIAVTDISVSSFSFHGFIKKFTSHFSISDEEILQKKKEYEREREEYEKKRKELEFSDIKEDIKEPEIPISKVELVLVPPTIYKVFDLKYKGITLEELKYFSKRISIDDKPDENSDEIDIETYLKMLLTYALINESSDIHLEPSLDNQFRISMRFKGFRDTIDFINIGVASRLIGVIKTRSKMDTQNMRSPQDGMLDGSGFLDNYQLPITRGKEKDRPTFNFEKSSFRISTYPTVRPSSGIVDVSYESVVIRLLSSGTGLVDLDMLGISDNVFKELRFAINRNQGIVIIVGPTGSGKSTTLYSTLNRVDAIKKKIISFEDPVEIRNMYWAQAERKVTEQENITFDFKQAKKSILRQDPDIILMGEVRDEESAAFALEASNTGHLVFTTLHANTAAAAVERLVKLDVKPLELASSLLCIISQRLVRQVCPHCKKEEDINEKHIDMLKRLEVDESHIPKKVVRSSENGCPMCKFSGYVGRTLLDEVIPINTQIKQLITDNSPEFMIRQKASEQGYSTMLENGLSKMNRGITTIDEILRVI